jgi:hypothetical protein
MLDQLTALRAGWEPTDYSKRLLVPDSRVCIASDMHIPYHDEVLLAQMLENCKTYQIESIIWLGDLMGMPTFSPWGRTDFSTSFKRELDILQGVIELAASVVPFQYWTMGNHEQWWMKRLDNQLYLDSLARMAGLENWMDAGILVLSDNPFIELFESRWLACHPYKSTGHAFDFASRLARDESKNVMMAHTHRWGMQAVGDLVAVESGGLFNPALIDYAQGSGSQGYWFLIDNNPIGFRKA